MSDQLTTLLASKDAPGSQAQGQQGGATLHKYGQAYLLELGDGSHVYFPAGHYDAGEQIPFLSYQDAAQADKLSADDARNQSQQLSGESFGGGPSATTGDNRGLASQIVHGKVDLAAILKGAKINTGEGPSLLNPQQPSQANADPRAGFLDAQGNFDINKVPLSQRWAFEGQGRAKKKPSLLDPLDTAIASSGDSP